LGLNSRIKEEDTQNDSEKTTTKVTESPLILSLKARCNTVLAPASPTENMWLIILRSTRDQPRWLLVYSCHYQDRSREEAPPPTRRLKDTQDGSKKRAMVHRQPPHVLEVQAKRKSGYRKGMGRKRVDLKAQLLETARASDLQLRALQIDRSS
jgi:hypothetical protein